MQVLLINNDGGGFAGKVEIEAGTTVEKLFKLRMSGRQAEDYLIRVNRQPCSREQVLNDGDRISITPVKIEGARR